MVNVQRNLRIICDPSSQILHSILFAFCAVITIFYLAWFLQYENVVYLSNFDMLSKTDFTSSIVPNTKDELLRKWQCSKNDTGVDKNWGPDSICRCLRNKECAADIGCRNVEEDCHEIVVPAYAHVYAGVDNSYFNIVIAFLFIHISVLLNMTIPLMKEKMDEYEDDSGSYDPLIPTGTASAPEAPTKGIPIINGRTNNARIDINSHFEYFGGGAPRTPAQLEASRKQSETAKAENARNREIAKLQADSATNRPIEGEPNGETGTQGDNDCYATWVSDHVTKNVWVRLGLLFVLSAACLIWTGMAMTAATNKASTKEPKQQCDLASCMTQTFTTILTFVVSLANLGLAGYLLVVKWFARHVKQVFKENIGDTKNSKSLLYNQLHITLAQVMEDVSVAAAFMLLVSTFSAQGGTRDDTTLFFDMALIAFIAFMLRLQHDIMLYREDVIECCDDSEAEIVHMDSTGKQHTLREQVMSYFLNTRLFIFAVIIGSSFVFVQRLQATTGVLDTHSTWNQSMRMLVLFVSILPNLCNDVSYELEHALEMRKNDKHKSYVGPQIWKRTIYLGYVLVLIASSWGTDTDVVMALTPTTDAQ